MDDHKTTRHQGLAEITMDEHLYGYTKLYVQIIRPCFAASGETHLFVKDDGLGFNHATIGRRISEVFRRADIRRDVRVTATNIRKLFSSSAAQMSSTKKHTINSYMKHKESTADANYVIKVNTQQASKAHKLIRSIIDEKAIEEERRETATRSLSKEESDDDDDDDVPLSELFEKPLPSEDDQKSKLTSDDKVVIASVVGAEMEAGKMLTRHEVRDNAHGSPSPEVRGEPKQGQEDLRPIEIQSPTNSSVTAF